MVEAGVITLRRRDEGLSGFVRRLTGARAAGFGVLVVAVMLLSALLAPLVAPRDPIAQDLSRALNPPSAEHWLGTDHLGRDVFSRVVWGSQVSLQVGVIALGIAVTVGVPAGLFAAYWGNWIDGVVMRIMDALMAFPALVLAISIVAVLGPNLTNAIVAIGIVNIPGYARLVRGQVLSMKEREFVEAARAIGAGDVRIVVRHIFPNVTAPIIVQTSIGIAFAILTEAGLSFLGLGAQPPTPSWGSMLQQSYPYLGLAPWVSLAAGGAIFLTVMGLNFVGDALRDALDPRLRHQLQGGGEGSRLSW